MAGLAVTPREELYARLAAHQHRRFIKTHTPLDGILVALLGVLVPAAIINVIVLWTRSAESGSHADHPDDRQRAGHQFPANGQGGPPPDTRTN